MVAKHNLVLNVGSRCIATELNIIRCRLSIQITIHSEEDGEEDCVEVVVGLKGKINFLFC